MFVIFGKNVLFCVIEISKTSFVTTIGELVIQISRPADIFYVFYILYIPKTVYINQTKKVLYLINHWWFLQVECPIRYQYTITITNSYFILFCHITIIILKLMATDGCAARYDAQIYIKMNKKNLLNTYLFNYTFLITP